MRWMNRGQRRTRCVAAAVLAPSLLLSAVPRAVAADLAPTPVAVDDTFTVYGRPVEGGPARPSSLPPRPSYAPTPTEAGPGAPAPSAYPAPSAGGEDRPAPERRAPPPKRFPDWLGWFVVGILAAVAIAASDDD